MRILHVVPTYLPATRYGGPIRSVHGLCSTLAHRGHDVHVFTTNVDGDLDSDVPLDDAVDLDGVRVHYFPSTLLRRLYYSPLMRRRLDAEVASFDLAHLHSIYLWPTMAAARAARRHAVPFVISPRGMLVTDLVRRKSRWIKQAWIRLVEARNFRDATAIHFTSRIEREEAEKFELALPNPFVVPNGVEIRGQEVGDGNRDRAANGQTTNDQRPTILFLGRVNWKKGLDRLIRAMEHLPDRRLTIAGNDEENHRATLEGLADVHGVLDRVEFLGAVGNGVKGDLLRRAGVLVLPSYSENFGNVVLEAMAAGCPVVVTPEVGAADIVAEVECGLVAEGEPETLAEAIRSILEDPDRAGGMGERGRNAVDTRFTWDAIASQMEQAYEKILGTR